MKIEEYAPTVEVQITLTPSEYISLKDVCIAVVEDGDDWHLDRIAVCQAILDNARKPTRTKYKW